MKGRSYRYNTDPGTPCLVTELNCASVGEKGYADFLLRIQVLRELKSERSSPATYDDRSRFVERLLDEWVGQSSCDGVLEYDKRPDRISTFLQFCSLRNHRDVCGTAPSVRDPATPGLARQEPRQRKYGRRCHRSIMAVFRAGRPGERCAQCTVCSSSDQQQQYVHSKGWTHGSLDATTLHLERSLHPIYKMTGIVGEAERFRPFDCADRPEVKTSPP